MKKLLILLFSILISFNSYGGWEKITEIVDGHVFYVDKDSIKEHNGSVYFWSLVDYPIPNDNGTMSSQSYYQGDCNLKRDKTLSFSFYKKSMGKGESNSFTPPEKWRYLPSSSASLSILNYVCDQVY